MEKYRTERRNNYMSLPDMYQDCSTFYLIKIVGELEMLKDQLIVMRELEKRLEQGELSEKGYYNALHNCNGK